MVSRGLCCVLIFLAAAGPARSAPFLPASENEVLERLPIAPSDPALRELREMNSKLKEKPDNLALALRVGRGYAELGRSTGDPRYVGYAQAALAPWWGLENPPTEAQLLRAALRQRVHQFDDALADLAAVLALEPRNAQARLMRATVLQVTGAFEPAREECRALTGLRLDLVRRACLASVDGATGRLREAYDDLGSALKGAPAATPPIRAWVSTMLAEMAARANLPQESESYFRAALEIEPDDFYLLGAYADFLLDHGRPEQVETLLKGKERVDPLLLRLALSAKAQKSEALAERVEQLRDRFAASRMRGDSLHLREEARFTLSLLNDPKGALKLAQDNWRVQKEPADIRILVEAALAARDVAALKAARDWLTETGLQDFHLDRIFSASAHPN